ncbi:MAG: hypothetical protein VXZ36_08285, partial [Pseudomonadota bacterium]|nr:hypothetical protein [Pseudomonadota bacterium]
MSLLKSTALLSIAFLTLCINANTIAATSNTVGLTDTSFAQLPKALTLKGNALPFENYQQWLAHAQSNNQKIAFVDRWQKRVNPKTFNTLIKQTSAQWIEYESDGLKISGVMVAPKN